MRDGLVGRNDLKNGRNLKDVKPLNKSCIICKRHIMYIYTVIEGEFLKRTQIYLDEKLHALLKEESRKSGKTISEIIRNKLRKSFEESSNRKKQLLKAVDEAFGIWGEYGIEPESYVRALREDRKLDSH